MDVAIIREVFPHGVEASKILGIDAGCRNKLDTALTKLPPYQISSSGFLQEWIEDWKPAPAGHNVSPNFTIYPGGSIRLHRDTLLAQAIQKWMYAHHARGGFAAVWEIAVWARLERGDKVAETIKTFVSNSLAPNLHNKGANQSDATFGYTAAVAESLIQSHDEGISLLPALSGAWKDGSVDGLRARVGFDVIMECNNGQLPSPPTRNLTRTSFKLP